MGGEPRRLLGLFGQISGAFVGLFSGTGGGLFAGGGDGDWFKCVKDFFKKLFGKGDPPPGITVTGVTIYPSSTTIKVGDKAQLTATVQPSDASNKSVSWSSNNTNVATVNSSTGLVTAQAVGTATITVKTADGGKTATCAVTVQSGDVLPTSIIVKSSGGVELTDASPLHVYIGPSYKQTVTVTVGPTGATNKSYNWTTEPTSSIATRSNNTFEGKSENTTSATVTTAVNNRSASFKIIAITRRASPISVVMIDNVILKLGPHNTLYGNGITLYTNDKLTVRGSYGLWYYVETESGKWGFVPQNKVATLYAGTYGVGGSFWDIRTNAPNCMGYVLGRTYEVKPVAPSNPSVPYISEEYKQSVIHCIMTKESFTNCRPIDAYNSPITANEYRVAFRKHQSIEDGFHIAMQLSNGDWAGKNGTWDSICYPGPRNPSNFQQSEDIWYNKKNLLGQPSETTYTITNVLYFAVTR